MQDICSIAIYNSLQCSTLMIDPASSLATNWQISSLWKMIDFFQILSNSLKLFRFLGRIMIQIVETKQHIVDVFKQRAAESSFTGQFKPVRKAPKEGFLAFEPSNHYGCPHWLRLHRWHALPTSTGLPSIFKTLSFWQMSMSSRSVKALWRQLTRPSESPEVGLTIAKYRVRDLISKALLPLWQKITKTSSCPSQYRTIHQKANEFRIRNRLKKVTFLSFSYEVNKKLCTIIPLVTKAMPP